MANLIVNGNFSSGELAPWTSRPDFPPPLIVPFGNKNVVRLLHDYNSGTHDDLIVQHLDIKATGLKPHIDYFFWFQFWTRATIVEKRPELPEPYNDHSVVLVVLSYGWKSGEGSDEVVAFADYTLSSKGEEKYSSSLKKLRFDGEPNHLAVRAQPILFANKHETLIGEFVLTQANLDDSPAGIIRTGLES